MAPVEVEPEPPQVLEPPTDPRAIPEADSPIFFAAVRRLQKTLPTASPREIHDAAHSLALLDLGRDPETGEGCALMPRENPPADFDTGQAYREHSAQAQVLEEGEQ